MTISLENLQKDVRLQKESDKQMSNVWLLVYLLPIGVGIIFSVYFLVSFIDIVDTIYPASSSINFSNDRFGTQIMNAWITIGLTGVVNFAVGIVLTYKLVNRRHTHFKRQKFLSEDLIASIKSIGKMKDINVETSLSSIERTLREANTEETEKSGILWAILTAFIPFVQLYVYYFLMNDFYSHEQKEDGLWEEISMALNKLSINFSVLQRIEYIPNRSFVLYLILTIITGGLFVVYWLYILLTDPNEHFKYHIQAENQLISTLEPVLTQNSSKIESC
ncbi:hypothetical protein ACFLRN_10220 [Thermoproteota archaeon]